MDGDSRELAAQLDRARRVNQRLRDHMDQIALRSPVHLAAHLDPAYTIRAHIDLIGRAFADVGSGAIKRLLITMPPQSGKSVTAAVWGPFWWLARHRDHRVALGSYAASLAVTRGRAVRKRVIEHGQRYGLTLDRGSAAANDWELESGGGMRSVGIGGGLTGRPADIAIIDDPHKDRADADSPIRRQAVRDWWSGTLVPRLQPGAPAVLIQTRWHLDDLAGWLLHEEGTVEQGGQWTVLYLPAIATPPKQAAAGGLTLTDGLDRAPGEPLPHPKIQAGDTAALREHWATKKRGVSVRDWAALYQGDPAPAEGALLTYAQLAAARDYNPAATPVKHAVAIDPSGGGRDVAGIIGGWLGDDQSLYVTDDVSAVMSSEQWSRRACELAAQIGADRIIVERNYGGDMARLVIRTAWETLRREHQHLDQDGQNPYGGVPPMIVEVSSRKGKVLRADPVAQQLLNGRVWFTTRLPDLEEEWATWQPTSAWSPGRIDACVHLALNLLKIPGTGDLISTSTGVSKSQVAPRRGGWTSIPIRNDRR